MSRAIDTSIQPDTHKRYWNANGFWGDQELTSACTGFAWLALLEDGPVTMPGKEPIISPFKLYYEGQKRDEWPGEAYEGTSVLGVAKYIQELGLIGNYWWAYDIDTIIYYLLTHGPIGAGIPWHTSMFSPNANGQIIDISGPVEGGHMVVLNGVNIRSGWLRGKNSWGREWGADGFFYIKIKEFADKLITFYSEFCIATEIKPKKPIVYE
jgi:hypothetical protein